MTRIRLLPSLLALALLAACAGGSAGSSSTGPTTAKAGSAAAKTSFAAEFADAVSDDTEADYAGYTSITDDTGAIQVAVPTEWTDVDGSRWIFNGEDSGAALSVAPDLNAWNGTWGTPGVFIAASATLEQTSTEILDGLSFSGPCDHVDRYDYDDGLYVGLFDYYESCGNEGSTFIVVAAEPADGSFDILIEILVVTDRDLSAADEIVDTLQVIGPLD